MPLQEFKIPQKLTRESEILVHAGLSADQIRSHLNHPSEGHVRVEFTAPAAQNLFPTFWGALEIYPAAYGSESILELTGSYETPAEMLGASIDTGVGYTLAQRVVARFLHDVAEELHPSELLPDLCPKSARKGPGPAAMLPVSTLAHQEKEL